MLHSSYSAHHTPPPLPIITPHRYAGCILVLRASDRTVDHEDKTIQVAVTVGCAYISFFLAQYVLEVSGVISCVTSGVVLAWLGPPLVLQVSCCHP